MALMLLAMAALGSGCVREATPAEAASEPQPEVYSFDLMVSSRNNLPPCTHGKSGTTAFVEKPASLWSCQKGEWIEIPCFKLAAGTVAYSSTSKTLLACVQGDWTPIAVGSGSQGPAGPAGPAGPQGPQGDAGVQGPAGLTSLVKATMEPPGANCAAGGTKITIGFDRDADNDLDPGEVDSTTYVCNGASSTARPPCTQSSDCPVPDSACQARVCLPSGFCDVTNLAARTVLSSQIPGDCRQLVCDGGGGIGYIADDNDLPPDGVDCVGQQCLNGNAIPFDLPAGTACAEMGGTVCDGAGACVTPECGDGKVIPPESCDDGNAIPQDGCTACINDIGYVCTGAPSVCRSQKFSAAGTVYPYFLGVAATITAPTMGTFELVLAPLSTNGTGPDLCAPPAQLDLTGKVVLAVRGECLFYTKAINAQKAGAVGIVVYNNVATPGLFTAGLSPPMATEPPVTIPFAGISSAHGADLVKLLQNGSVSLTWLPFQ
jgi:cysteine-rich repeat protein